jgi:hypothetical protein
MAGTVLGWPDLVHPSCLLGGGRKCARRSYELWAITAGSYDVPQSGLP